MAAMQHLVGKWSPKALLCLQRLSSTTPGDRGLALRAPKRHRMIHFRGHGDVDINTPPSNPGSSGNHSEEDAGGGGKWEMRRNFWQGWEEAGAFGWLVGWLFFWQGRGLDRRSSSGTSQTLPRPQLSPGLKDRRQRIKELDTFYSTTSNLHLPHSGMNILTNPVTQALAVQQNLLQWWEHLCPRCPVHQPLITCGY